MPRRRPHQLRAEAPQHRTPDPYRHRPRGGAGLSGSARAAILRFYPSTSTMLTALETWRLTEHVVEPTFPGCEWECCQYCLPTPETRDRLEEMVAALPTRPAREVRRLLRATDERINGDADGPWWHNPLLWR